MEQYWPSELISEKARNTTGLVWPLQVSGVCLRLLMVTRVTGGRVRDHRSRTRRARERERAAAWDTGPGLARH